MNPIKTLQFVLSHPLNHGKPVQAIARYVRWQVESRIKSEIVTDWIEGTKLVARNGMTGATGNIYCGLQEYEDMAFILHILRSGDLFVDVGANIGSFTILASGVCQARSIAIEPDPQAAIHLERNIAENGLSALVKIVQTAIGASNGKIGFTKGLDTTNRVAIGTDEQTQIVPLATLDDVLTGAQPTVIKIDVEGFEHEVLSGARRTLAKSSLLAVLVETVEPASLRVLLDAGFVQRYYDPTARILETGSPRGANSLFVRDHHLLAERLRFARRRSYRGRLI